MEIARASVQTEVDKSILSENDMELYHSFNSADRRKEFLVSRFLAKKLAAQMGLNESELFIHKDEEGKPIAEYKGSHYYISITHSDGQVVCGLSTDVSIGVDIEPTARQITPELRNRIMGEHEVKTLQGVNTLRIWTMKEALLKLYGKKIGSSLRECIIHPSNSDIYNTEVKEQIKAKVFSNKLEKYWLAVAW